MDSESFAADRDLSQQILPDLSSMNNAPARLFPPCSRIEIRPGAG
jgi:hypothetical protein